MSALAPPPPPLPARAAAASDDDFLSDEILSAELESVQGEVDRAQAGLDG